MDAICEPFAQNIQKLCVNFSAALLQLTDPPFFSFTSTCLHYHYIYKLFSLYAESNSYRTELGLTCIRSAIIRSAKQNWTSTERVSNLFSRKMITDRIRRHEESYYKFIIKIATSKNGIKIKQSR